MPRSHPPNFTILSHHRDQPPDALHRQFIRPEPNHPPPCQRGFEVFADAFPRRPPGSLWLAISLRSVLQIRREAPRRVVTAVDGDAALDPELGNIALCGRVAPGCQADPRPSVPKAPAPTAWRLGGAGNSGFRQGAAQATLPAACPGG